MSLLDVMSEGARYKTVSVKEIRVNELNFYDIDDVEEMALSIKHNGQQTAVSVYSSVEENDEKKYTLLGGERRYQAICMLYEQEESDGMIQISIKDKPENTIKEKIQIQVDNGQRNKSQDTLLHEIQNGMEYYDYLVSINERPPGGKREFVASLVGKSGKTIDNILNRHNETQNGVQRVAREPNIEDVKKLISRSLKGLEKASNLADSLTEHEYCAKLESIIENLSEVVQWCSE